MEVEGEVLIENRDKTVTDEGRHCRDVTPQFTHKLELVLTRKTDTTFTHRLQLKKKKKITHISDKDG